VRDVPRASGPVSVQVLRPVSLLLVPLVPLALLPLYSL
jgi:hypothetical protein